jgi:3-oxoacid CoA-transferase subunit B
MLGGMEVSAGGDLANWIVPGQRVKGMGGAMDLAASPARLVVLMEHCHPRTGASKIVPECKLPLTGRGCVDRLITELAVFDFVEPGRGESGRELVLVELMPGVTIDEVRAKTAASFSVKL